EGPGRGHVVCTEVGQPTTDQGHASIRTRTEWRTADGFKVLSETRGLHLYDWSPARLLVVDIDLIADVVALTFADTKEGTFAVRVADALTEKKGGLLQTADGKKTEKECWGRLSDWCDYSGSVNGRAVGLAILDHPDNKPRAGWHSRAYGLMAA